ncbi:methyltransferase domain-containing protein [Streptomyces sp. MJP52]|uniref:methyltransferase domain-containing protein n=1 Tax=Streptomyces sp. MJP52 TaxID=2940555 RepID=UPI002476CFE8|nr:methyltransferase domain-containing protein [Streptomyces sp. MJP52]MDH6223735.1 SAM-dependent methyltransferase [Streptomyces sp. MJP52]
MGRTRETAVYTHGHGEAVLRSHRWRTAANSAAYLMGSLRPGMRVLDVGCGPGTLTADLAELVPGGVVVGLERAPGVLADARAEAARRGTGNVEFAVGDVHALPCPDGAFDVVHAHQVLQHVGDPVAALREMRRVTRPGGLVAARDSDYGAMSWTPACAGLDEWRAVYRRTARANGGEPDAGRFLAGWARGAGFDEVVVSSSEWVYRDAEDRAWWSGMWADRTLAPGYADRVRELDLADAQALEAVAAAWREWGRLPQGRFTVPHREILCRRTA